ncbi:unnamed protein product [Toxocara canis]|uniref:Histidine kinase n=1 Tax=Toxocara canis TaxID=6265 RepID=A0A183V9T7_TOXCA|nr:unnamed protein product [Toxocara canis]
MLSVPGVLLPIIYDENRRIATASQIGHCDTIVMNFVYYLQRNVQSQKYHILQLAPQLLGHYKSSGSDVYSEALYCAVIRLFATAMPLYRRASSTTVR